MGMTTIQNNHCKHHCYEKVREYYREVPKLLGMIRVTQVENIESIGSTLDVYTEKTPEKVFINGKEYRAV